MQNRKPINTVLTNKVSVYKLQKENLSYLQVLEKYFELRKKRNPRYSRRKYAQDLGLTAMHLNYIMRGKRGLSREKAESVASVLKLSSRDRKIFLQVVSALSGRSVFERNLAQLALRTYFLSQKN